MVGRPAPLSARECGSSPVVWAYLDIVHPRSPGAPERVPTQDRRSWALGGSSGSSGLVPPSLREPVFWSRRRGSVLSVGHFSPFPSEACCRPVGSRRPVVEVRTEARGCGRVSTCVKAIFRPP
ncbi:hypothetical protein NDU88_001608 [Pleurodeles waltl]|uniref:Uncharacterized protein n=1 Tax=Pleurodeles waltl TaxID=8319 RepID=A0AAV7MK84_PLEWA|nr:hypothetical protein NDU88_001608 [Pleurodeles waltl]